MDHQINNKNPVSQSSVKSPRRFRKWFSGMLAALMLAAMTSGLYWLVFTSSGLHWLFATASRATNGALTFSGISGSLQHAFHAQTITFKNDGLDARVENLDFRWQPQRLLTGNLLIEALTIQSVEVHSAPSEEEEEPVTQPESLSLPIGMVIEKLGIRSLKTYTLGNDQPDLEISDLVLRLDSDGKRHRLQTLALELEQGKIAGNLEIAPNPPFDLTSQLVFYSWANAVNADNKPSHAVLKLSGNLQQIRAKLAVKDGELNGAGIFTIHPFDKLPLLDARLVFNGLNPHVFSPDLPKADLSIRSYLEQTQAERLEGRITVSNTMARPLGQEGIPLKDMRLQFLFTGDDIHLDDIALRLSEQEAAPGSLTGKANWQISTKTGQADIQVRQLNPASLKSGLHPANLSGNLHFAGDQDVQHGMIKLRDEVLQMNIDMALARAASVITIEKLDLARGDSSLSGHGVLQLDESQPFTFEGLLKQFDISAFADVPSSNLNAKFNLGGQLAPQPIANINFSIDQSHFSNQPVTGQGTLALLQSRRVKSDARLHLGDNQLEIKGALGNAEDHLSVVLAAPRLTQIGFGLQGDMHSRIELSGKIDRPDVAFELNSNHFNFHEEHQLAQLKAKGSLRGTVIQLDLQTGAYQKGTEIFLQQLSVGLDGTQSNHQLLINSQIDQTTEAQFQAKGGLITRPGDTQHFQWDGIINKLALTGSVPLDLVTQPSVRISPEAVVLGHTHIKVIAGDINILDAHWTPKQWSTRGNFSGIALQSGGLSPKNYEPLKLGGDWQFAADRQLTGRLHVQREKGDFILPTETPFALGLQTLAFNLLAENNNLNGQLVIRGAHVGEATARVSVPLQPAGSVWEIQKNAPLNGDLHLNLPDLTWVGSVIGDNLRSEGQLAAHARLAGTLEQPELQGSVTGDALVIALLDQGLQLKEGKLAVDFNQDRVLLETLNFTAPLEKPTKDKLLKGLKLTQKSGRLSAHGSVNIHNQQSNLAIEIDHLPVAQQEDRWIVVSGTSLVGFSDNVLDVTGKIMTDVGFIKQPEAGTPNLAEDIIITGKTDSEPESQVFKINLDATLDLGERFFLRASGLEGRLVGQLRLHSEPGRLLNAVGTIATRDTHFGAYSQNLLVRRGIVNFDGPLDNPGLNILAVRSGLQVEAGIEITGTVRQPKIKLVSQPEVPDSEKLSWIVLGRPTDKSGLDSGLLLSAAGSILGGSDEGVLDSITQGLGIDDFSIRQQEGGSLTDQVGMIGKRLSSRAYLSFEHGLTSASAGVAKLTYSLFPHVSVVTRAGDDSAVDLFYDFQFD
ncbi:translocation/assembly module TamB domain-containing protein [Nitrosomonas eutropha]|uniref:Autotransporter secretion inner membrane protein TamB n=2 Tax=Nitrosomonas eutropha TaxID=916 RepID=A0ABX5M6F6_9PROT|nr:translocation/assembly module TamB domain-containing protein [Nitrosomonas eutropha]ABI59656.1 protein of unknown function DUF490 [Nitrosomonas eutropha C91]PXV80617.1 autotransporter secretion inner membrane protein TamB [Nitrosomonas eutropha]